MDPVPVLVHPVLVRASATNPRGIWPFAKPAGTGAGFASTAQFRPRAFERPSGAAATASYHFGRREPRITWKCSGRPSSLASLGRLFAADFRVSRTCTVATW